MADAQAAPGLDPGVAGWFHLTEPAAEPSTVEESRELTRHTNGLAAAKMSPRLRPASEDDVIIDGPGGELTVRVVRPHATGPHPTIVYLHGGGWVVGDLDTHIGHARRLSAQTPAVVVSVGYRRAPEHRFPAAFEDCLAAATWAGGHLADLGGDPDALVVAGDSAGAQMAASIALARRDAGLPLAAQLLLYPVVDATGRYLDPQVNAAYPSRTAADHGYGLTLEGMQNFAGHYLGADADTSDWRVSPFRAADLTGVAPAVVHTATLDILRSEGNRYARALGRAGVQVVHREWPTLNHSYFGLGGVSAVADGAAQQAADDLREVLTTAPAEG